MTRAPHQGTGAPRRGWLEAGRLGLLGRCPRCGEGRLFGRFLVVADACEACGLELHHHRADDFPPYIVILIVGHLVGWGILITELNFDEVPLWMQLAVWPALTVILALALLQPVKGAVVALQYALGMHGFGTLRSEDDGDGAELSRRTMT